MNFVSLQELYRDVAAWERVLPAFDAVVGVPRSGLIPAAYIALRRNIRLVDLADLIRMPAGAIERAALTPSNPLARAGRPRGNSLLVVDDSASDESETADRIRRQLGGQRHVRVSFGCLYRSSAHSRVDYHYREVPLPRIFGWNWFRNWHLQAAMLDMDGVICEDWAGPPEQSNDPAYLAHLTAARPLYPPQVPVRAVVTSRLERHRPQTAAWLARHGVQYGRLIMHPAGSPDDRRRAADHARRKAAAYAADAGATLFVESDAHQARAIAKSTGKATLCLEDMLMYR